MTIEKEVYKICLQHISANSHLHITAPDSLLKEFKWKDVPASIEPSLYFTSKIKLYDYVDKIDDLIRQASDLECFLSPSPYIRGCKRYFNDKGS